MYLQKHLFALPPTAACSHPQPPYPRPRPLSSLKPLLHSLVCVCACVPPLSFLHYPPPPATATAAPSGGISTPGAVGVFGSEGGNADQSAVAVCAYTDDRVVHRVLLQRPVAPPGEKVRILFTSRITCIYIYMLLCCLELLICCRSLVLCIKEPRLVEEEGGRLKGSFFVLLLRFRVFFSILFF